MYQNRKISLLIPCYNEEEGIKIIFKNLPSFFDEVIVVDNNSTDNTAKLAVDYGAKVITEIKRGYGHAYQAGFKNVSGDIVVTMDGDNSYPIEEVVTMLEYLIGGNYDFVSGCRFPLKNPISMHYLNRFGNRFLTLIFNLIILRRIKDSQSGMWVFKREVLSFFDLKSGGMPLSEEIKMEAILNEKIKFSEFHISYHPRLGEVKLNKWWDGLKNLFFLIYKRFEIIFR